MSGPDPRTVLGAGTQHERVTDLAEARRWALGRVEAIEAALGGATEVYDKAAKKSADASRAAGRAYEAVHRITEELAEARADLAMRLGDPS